MVEHFEPKPHQPRMAQHVIDHPSCALWLDMGAGKTSIVLMAVTQLIEDLDVSKILVVAPPRVAMNTWTGEIARWDCFQDLTCRALSSDDFKFARREVTIKRKKASTVVKRLVPTALATDFTTGEDIHTISRDNLIYLVKLLGVKHWAYDLIVIDESDGFRDQESKRFAAAKVIRKHFPMSRIVELSGTPRPKSLMDLWPQIYLLDGGQRLGCTLSEYRDTYFNPGRKGKDANGKLQVFNWEPKPGAEEQIFAKVADLCVSLLPEDVIKLPERTINIVPLTLESRGRHAYDAMERDSLLQLVGENGAESDSVAPNRAALVGKLLQLASGAVYDENKVAHHIHDTKLDFLEELVESLNGAPLLVAYWFKHELERIKARFPHAVELNDSPDTEARWNAGQIDMLLLHPQSGAHGLNLQFNDGHGCWMSVIHDLALWLQWNKRLHRPGRKTPVFIHVPIVQDTIEGAVLESLDPKNAGQDRLLRYARMKLEGGKP